MTAQAKLFAHSAVTPVTADDGVVPVPHSRHDARSNHLPSRWLTQTLDQRLTELHAQRGADELSCAQIAWQLNDEFNMQMSRNAVIGRINRLHLPPRKRYLRRGRPVKIPPVKPKITFTKKPKPITSAPANLPLLQLKDRDCHFAITAEPPFLFCAQPAVAGSSWCRAHFKLVHARAP